MLSNKISWLYQIFVNVLNLKIKEILMSTVSVLSPEPLTGHAKTRDGRLFLWYFRYEQSHKETENLKGDLTRFTW